MDDGTTSRLADDRYFMTTTTANAARVLQHMQFCHQVLWPELDVQFASVTDQWAQFSIAGPRARELLAGWSIRRSICRTMPLPFMAAREIDRAGRHAGAAVPHLVLGRAGLRDRRAGALRRRARRAPDAARRASSASRPTAPRRSASCASRRATSPATRSTARRRPRDLGLGRMMSTKKDFIGRVMAGRQALVAPDRPVVGRLQAGRPAARLRAGAHIIPNGRSTPRPTTIRALSPRSASRRRSATGSGSAWSRAAAAASARSCALRSAAQRRRRGRALPSLLLRSGRRAPAWLTG